jgi:hypothetical protein
LEEDDDLARFAQFKFRKGTYALDIILTMLGLSGHTEKPFYIFSIEDKQ